ncbi:exodeoxyribonuclease VII large subunit [Piscinibacter sakaiensis]|uniref:Exodeoxyribonuclease 7 large subunit n=1 Tax=Piscinibacter sakaiensis TaxID=1547922 RepID=A0A0K8NTI1_PISS1|nr:exodeoxyribonuclease VII large subunit [Piscinibacter sakaiensis]GAP33687.1 exodeoxyribonuclease VII, large subunit [Piscinibacter sakaiensis]
MDEPLQAAPMLPRQVWGVAALVHAVADTLASRFGACTVRGEVSGFSRAASGHCYFSLKDDEGGDALLRCAMFRRTAGLLGFPVRDGLRVVARGRIAVYEPRGDLQFVVESLEPAGAGALYEQFLRLKARLEAEGLFAAARKRPLPRFPTRVGVVTSPGAAALRDVASTFARRAPHVALVIYPSPVQGAEAPPALVRALAEANRRAEVDLLLLCRGGGSLEDLWAFNDERVVRAVAASRLVTVCGVGHETDVSLCDFAADLRAPTPTAAAELAAPATQECLDQLGGLAGRLQRRSRQLLDNEAQRLDRVALRLLRPSQLVHREARRLDQAAARLAGGLQRTLEGQAQRLPRLAERLRGAAQAPLAQRQRRLGELASALGALDPARVLRRGYAWLGDAAGRPQVSVHQLAVGDRLQAVLSDGRADVQVTALQPQDEAAAPAPATGRADPAG